MRAATRRTQLSRVAKQAYGLLRDAAVEFWDDKAMRLGAAIAYYAIFAIGPLLMVVIAIGGLVFGREAAQHEIVETLGRYIGASGAEAIERAIASSSQTGGGWKATLIGLVVLLFGATGLFGQLEDALNTVWEVRPKRRGLRRAIRVRLLSFTVVVGSGFLLLVSLVVTAGLAAVGRVLADAIPGGPLVMQVIYGAFSFMVITLIFALIFKVLPGVVVRWRDVWVGAAVTALLFSLGQFLLGLYIRTASIASSHGAAGSLIVVLVWVYYSSLILFYGAEFTQVYASRFGSGARLKDHVVPLVRRHEPA